MGPREHEAPGVGLPSVRARDPPVQLEPVVDLGLVGIPPVRAVVAVPRGHHSVGLAHAPHVAQRADRIRKVLQHLVRVHDVERRVGKVERVHVTDGELHIVDSGRVLARLRDHVRGCIDTHHRSGCDSLRDIESDRPRPTPNVEHPRARDEMRRDIGRRVLDGPPSVRSQNALVVAMGVGHAVMISRSAKAAVGVYPSRARALASLVWRSRWWFQHSNCKLSRLVGPPRVQCTM